MIRILYIGNKLHNHGFNKTSIETLGVFLRDEGFSIIYTSDKKNQFYRLLDMIKTTFLNAKKVDYILIDTYSTSSFWFAFFCSQIARLFYVKYIPLLRGGDLPNRLKNNPFLCKMIFNNAYQNVSPSNYLKIEFEKKGFKNVLLIPNSIEITNYPFLKRENFAPKLLWVRAFATIYNPKMAIDVFKILKNNYPNAELCMVGPDKDGSLFETKQYAKDNNLEVKFTGKLSKSEWIYLSQEYDFFINTTHFDNTPISVIEAMALGLAVISTNVGGIPDLLENEIDSLLVADNDVSEMVNCIIKSIENQSEINSRIFAARIKAEQFDWDKISVQWKKLLK